MERKNNFGRKRTTEDENTPRRTSSERYKKTDSRKFSSRDDNNTKKTFRKREEGEERPFTRNDNKPKRFSDEENKSNYKKREGFEERRPRSFDKNDKPRKFAENDDSKKPYKRRDADERPARSFDRDDKPKREYKKRDDNKGGLPYERKYEKKTYDRKPSYKKSAPKRKQESEDGAVRLNKFIANSGICSRREADELIQAGAVMVNGVVVTELGTKIMPTDKVQYGTETIKREKNVYLLLNKPKGYITTTDDPFDRNTVMTLIADACKERIYPVGRLDRNTTGLLLFTNDGELAKKLTHPSHKVKKVYRAELDKPLTKQDMIKIGEGVQLEDGVVYVDEIAYVEGESKRDIGVELHSGRNRIVRRIFEAFGYEVVKLDRTVFAGLTKKDLPRGKWRFLTDKEVSFLQMIK